jgi:hypothetical protein
MRMHTSTPRSHPLTAHRKLQRHKLQRHVARVLAPCTRNKLREACLLCSNDTGAYSR